MCNTEQEIFEQVRSKETLNHKVMQSISLQCGIPTQTNDTTQSSTAADDSTMLATTNKMDAKECDTTITSVLGAVILCASDSTSSHTDWMDCVLLCY